WQPGQAHLSAGRVGHVVEGVAGAEHADLAGAPHDRPQLAERGRAVEIRRAERDVARPVGARAGRGGHRRSDQVEGRGAPYHCSMIWRAMDTGGGSAISRALIAASSSSRLNQYASAISSRSTTMAWPAGASARKPSIRLRGIGQGWLPTYRTLVTLIWVSS